ncbi:hypothetical protein OSB04_003557 [Centaurea solstitialis]|uniref:Uncharacterized protein n=1 Tax=Centaurea solstitialis TaxID=347529 RepID=A0AA38WVR7_9ASTR|nr:hypothetical protein OSB04_003557 [Centaurea solstitialis]
MVTEEEKDFRKILIVVLDGSKVLMEADGVSPLRYALPKAEDEVVVLVIFNSGDLIQSPVVNSSCCIGSSSECRNDEASEKQRYVRILREEISQGTEAYMRIFRPFYKECKTIGIRVIVDVAHMDEMKIEHVDSMNIVFKSLLRLTVQSEDLERKLCSFEAGHICTPITGLYKLQAPLLQDSARITYRIKLKENLK